MNIFDPKPVFAFIRVISDRIIGSHTYNEAGVTYNEPGFTYNGITGGDVATSSMSGSVTDPTPIMRQIVTEKPI